MPPSVIRTTSLLVFCVGISFAQTASLALASGSSSPGASISLPLSLSTSAGATPAALQWTVSYSATDFSGATITLGSSGASAGKSLECDRPSAGRLVCLLSGMNKSVIPNGPVATATFAVSSTTGSTSSAIQVSQPGASSPAGWTIGATSMGATVTIDQPKVNSLSCSPSTVQGPATSTCTATLLKAAPAGGVSVSLGNTVTGGASVTMPSAVTVSAGATSANFAVQVGTATATSSVTVSASAGGVTKTSVVTVTPAAAISISVSPSSATLAAGQSRQFSATVSGTTNTNVVWSISPQVGTISASGLYVAPASVTGSTSVVVTATTVATPAKSHTAQVTLVQLSSLSCSPSSIQGPGTATCTAALSAAAPSGGLAVALSYTSTNGVAVTIPSSVTVASGAGSATFSAQVGSATAGSTVTLLASQGGVTRTATLQVSSAIGITVSPSTVTLGAGQSQQFTAAVTGTTNTGVVWSISPLIGAISTSGRYVAPAGVAATMAVTVTATTVATPSKTATARITLVPDVTPPVISEVSVSPWWTSAVISWQTDKLSDSVVLYGTSPSGLNMTASDGTMVTAHGVRLKDLARSTTYYFRVLSRDAAGNLSVSPLTGSSPLNFRTISSPRTATGTTATRMSWMTDTQTVGTIRYGTSPTSLNRTITETSLAKSHEILITGLAPDTKYYFRITCADSTGASVVWPDSVPDPDEFTQNSSLSLWPDSSTPAIAGATDSSAVELGVRFESDVAAVVTGIRFFKSFENTGTHFGHLWTSSGTLLGTVIFTNETAYGWQQANFTSPIPISANTAYIVSYYAPRGRYALTEDHFAKTISNASLSAPYSSTQAPNGLYKYGSSGFPTASYNRRNYWVDVVIR